MGAEQETYHVSVSSRHLNAVIIAVIGGLFSLGVAYIANKPDTADRYYGHQGREAERRIGLIEEWVRQHTIFGWETSVSNERRFAELEAASRHATEVTRECMEKVK